MYLKSTGVKGVYPTAYRDATYDANSDNTTEFNLANSVHKIGGRNYVVFYDDTVASGEVALRVSLGGYNFDILKSAEGLIALQNNSNHTDIYLYIRALPGSGTDYTFTQLLSADDDGTSVASLDVEDESLADADKHQFVGLGYSYGPISGNVTPTDSLKVFTWDDTASKWVVPSTSFSIISTSQIRDTDEHTLNEEFHTETLDVSGVTYARSGLQVDSGLLKSAAQVIISNTAEAHTIGQGALKVKGGVSIEKKLNVGGDTAIGGTFTVGTNESGKTKSTTLNGDATINGVTTINNQATGFKISGGTTTSKNLDIQADTTIQGATSIGSGASVSVAASKTVAIDANMDINGNLDVDGTTHIYAPLTVGASGNTSTITLKQNSNKTFTIVGAKTSGQSITFNGDSTFQAGDYGSVNTTGSETVTVGGNTFNMVTRDTDQTISGSKTLSGVNTFTGTLKVKGADDSTAKIVLVNKDNDTAISIKATKATAARTITLPNDSGTVILSGDTTSGPSATVKVGSETHTHTIGSIPKYFHPSFTGTAATIAKTGTTKVSALTNITFSTSDAAPDAHTHNYTKPTGVSLSVADASVAGRVTYVQSISNTAASVSATAAALTKSSFTNGVLTLVTTNVATAVTGGTTTATTKYLGVGLSTETAATTANSGDAVAAYTSHTPTTKEVAAQSHTHSYTPAGSVSLGINDTQEDGFVFIQAVDANTGGPSATTPVGSSTHTHTAQSN